MKYVLIGNQNSDKTTIFNALTNGKEMVGNWPGVTVSFKEGIIRGTDNTLIDLPGVYSLSPYTKEEEVTVKYIFNNQIDGIINVIDLNYLERSLYLTTELLEIEIPLIILLNFHQKPNIILSKYIEEKFKIKVLTFNKNKINELISSIKFYDKKPTIFNNELSILNKSIPIKEKYLNKNNFENIYLKYNIKRIEDKYKSDFEEIITSNRYSYIDSLLNSINYKKDKKVDNFSNKLDKILLNKYLALPIFIILMITIYVIFVGGIGSKLVDALSNFTNVIRVSINYHLTSLGVVNWLVSFVQGIIGGVIAVVNFVPQLFILFSWISFLELSGYMNRITIIFDKLFQKLGLSGKSIIPFIIGSSCSVPGIMSSRTIENENEKIATIVCTPFVPCSAKLPLITLFAGSFFNKYTGLITVLIYFISIILIILSSLIMKKYLNKCEKNYFLMELPLYKIPSIRNIISDASDKVLEFIKRAGTIVFLSSILLWFLLSFSWDFWNGLVSIENSIMASIGKLLSFILYPLIGTSSWAATVCFIEGIIAKEQIISSMSLISGITETNFISIFESKIFYFFNEASFSAYLFFCLFSSPCIGSINAMRKELGSNKKLLYVILYQTLLAYIISFFIYRIWIMFI